MAKQYFLVANWKMNMDFDETTNFIREHGEDLIRLTSEKKINLVLCPSLPSLYLMNTIFEDTPIAVGAQNCSSHLQGNFTGQVSAKTIHETGCKYCIIGHSETRKIHKETNEEIAKKLIHLIDYDVSPILCIGETTEEHKAGKTLDVLKKQLENIFIALRSTIKVPNYLKICIAYEPIWAIGTGEIPSKDHLDVVFGWLRNKLNGMQNTINFELLYGGSVDKENIKGIKSIGNIDGFLVGKASIQYNQLEEMIYILTGS